ncbi:hypothetical protein [Brevibacterium spongiae]|uniref:DUF3592 domain-containing protein n=1 Tax=Brevibacterium spongiae TaxID=2909672 RepID=A0ABY5SNE4_9MICO|nr:hypothetical protein [Brevibacterium spongiae]UVI36053.1 hypothetical protein L1F31_18385 [Brevibacterium spongiae]
MMDSGRMRSAAAYGNRADRRWNRGSRNPLSIVVTGAVFVVGIGLVFAIGYLFPSVLLVTIILGCLVFVGVTLAMRGIMGHTGAYWYTGPVVAIALIGTVMLAEDVALSQAGEVAEVVVVDHEVDVKVARDSNGRHPRKVFTHTYTLERTDGTPVAEPMIYRGKDGFDDFDEGDVVSVLIDPEGKAPTKPVDDVDFAADIGILATGLVTSGIVFLICFIVVLLRWTRSPSSQNVR